MEKMNEICSEIGAKVVGYIKATSDFQIEFDRDLTVRNSLRSPKNLRKNITS